MTARIRRLSRLKLSLLVIPLTVALAVFAACSGDSAPDVSASDVVEHYADGVHHTYVLSLNSAMVMREAIHAFLDNPAPATLEGAKRAWLTARDDYGPTEAYRFYDGPIDNEEDGPEAQLNAWPLDESYVDYVEGNPDSGIINMVDEYPEISAELLIELNEAGGEANVSTGWHAIEFLLWGQDLNPDGPGDRPIEDYTTNANADRRATYLMVVTDLLIDDLQDMVNAWARGSANSYRAEFLNLDTDDALAKIITGIGELSRGELAGERMIVAYEARSQEDEHSCFSDNTVNDIIANARGIQNVWLGDFGALIGPGIVDLVRQEDTELADQLSMEIAASVAYATAIPFPFDAHLIAGLPNSDAGRRAVLTTIESLEDQTDTIVAAAGALGISINVT
ncbi:MAG: iron-regulated protein [Chloroflexota bacterium]|nr:iron-regulated protein [Chloroflexota bacterium]